MAKRRKQVINEAKLSQWINTRKNVLFVGRHGVGKTSIVKAAWDRAGFKYRMYSCATLDPWVDFIGVPEKKMGDDGEYSQNLFTGFMGKAYDQCKKIAVILHVMDNWEDGGQRSLSVNDEYVYWAISIFEELGKTFRAASDNLGHVGYNSEMQKLIEVLARRAESGKLKVNITSLRDSIKNTKPFDQIRYLQKTLRNKLLPAAQELNYCVLHGNTIYINPRLK